MLMFRVRVICIRSTLLLLLEEEEGGGMSSFESELNKLSDSADEELSGYLIDLMKHLTYFRFLSWL